ncbi:MAG: hypothetical protein ACLFSE_04295 [Spirochaetia bacterium]
MRILINKEQIDFSLEDEKNLGEVINELQLWLEKSRMTIDSLNINGKKAVPEEIETWNTRSIDEISEIDIEAKLNSEIEAEKLGAAFVAFKQLREGIDSGDVERTAQAAAEIVDSESIPYKILFDITGEEGLNSAKEIIEREGLISGNIPEGEEKTKTLTFADNVLKIITGRAKELAYPLREASAAAGILKGMIPRLNEVSVYLQTGRDEEAMNLIIRFAELTQKLLRLLPHLGSGEKGQINEEFARNLNDKLNEVVGAFHDQDSILLGDLMEYEITPCIEELLTYFLPVEKG